MSVTHARAALQMTYIAKRASSWAGDLLALPEEAGEPWRDERAARFVSEIQGLLSVITPPAAQSEGGADHE